MYSNENESFTGNRFIFTDDFYDNLDKQGYSQETTTNTFPSIEIPNIKPIENNNELEVNSIPQSNDIAEIDNIDETKFENENNNINESIETLETSILNTDNITVNNDYSNNDNYITQTEEISNTVNEAVDNNENNGMDTEQLLQPSPIYDNNSEIAYRFSPLEKEEKTVYRATRRAPMSAEKNDDTEPVKNIYQQPESIPNIITPKEEIVEDWKPENTAQPVVITEEINYYEPEEEVTITKSDLLTKLLEKERNTGKISILARYGEDFCSRDYITNPAIGRENEIKELGLILLTPEKSAILVGKPGIGKTSIVEGLAYRIQRNMVPDALKGYAVVSVKTTSLIGVLPNGETRLQTLINEVKDLDKIILFIDEVHMLMGATNESSLDFANMFKESLGRGNIKMIGATTNDEYERYVLRDKAFVRRFQRVDVLEPTKEQTVEILMGTLPKIENTTGAKLKYTHYVQVEIMKFIVDITTEYKRVYGIGSRYPDICITLINQAFSEAIFNNRKEVNILDIRNAIASSKNIYPDVIRKELMNFDNQFKNLINEENDYL